MWRLSTLSTVVHPLYRGRDRPHGRPPAQIPAGAANALGSCLGYERQSELRGMDA